MIKGEVKDACCGTLDRRDENDVASKVVGEFSGNRQATDRNNRTFVAERLVVSSANANLQADVDAIVQIVPDADSSINSRLVNGILVEPERDVRRVDDARACTDVQARVAVVEPGHLPSFMIEVFGMRMVRNRMHTNGSFGGICFGPNRQKANRQNSRDNQTGKEVGDGFHDV